MRNSDSESEKNIVSSLKVAEILPTASLVCSKEELL